MPSHTDPLVDPLQHGPITAPHTLPWLVRLLVIVAATKCAIALSVLTPLGPILTRPFGYGPLVLITLPALAASALMFLVHSRQNRTNHVGVAFLLIAVAPTGAFLSELAKTHLWLWPLSYGPLNVFFPYFLGRSLLEFPRARSLESTRLLRGVVNASLAIGVVRYLCGLTLLVRPADGLPWFIRVINGNIYQTLPDLIVSTQVAITTAAALTGLKHLLPQDNRRQRRIAYAWNTYGVASAYFAVMLIVKWPKLPGNPRPIWRIVTDVSYGWIIFLLPAAVSFAVLKGQGTQWRVRLRRTVLAVMNTSVLTVVALVPLTFVVAHTWRYRALPVDQVFARPVVPWMIASVIAALLLATRDQVMRMMNRRLFQNHYDPAETAFAIATAMRNAQSPDELAAHLTSGIDRALTPYRVIVLALDATGRQFVPLLGSGEVLPASAVIAELASASSNVLDTPLGSADSPMRWLPQDERYWLADCGARLIVPMRSGQQHLIGLIAISDRQDGRPFSVDDRRWLQTIAHSAALTLDAHAATGAGRIETEDNPWRVGTVARHANAHECPGCGRIEDARRPVCGECGSACTTALVPHTLLGKFQFERRIGKGGMGVVYRAHDIALDRPVAVKMLPGTTPEHAERLRQEARAMAAVTHRHLAVVYGVEAWRGQPLLFCEFMEHGTLADRQKSGAMSPREALAIGVAIADATQALHDRQLLHRDIKPSNIGFDRTGVPKLLDFGLAHLTATETGDGSIDGSTAAGTPLYMSPEALHGHAPGTAVDLWSLHVLLYEILAGTHPFRRGSTDETMHAILHDAAPPLVLNSTPTSHLGGRLQFYFASALHKDPGRRPRTAADVANALRAMGH